MENMNGKQPQKLSYEFLCNMIYELLVRVYELEKGHGVRQAMPVLPSIQDQRNWFLAAEKMGIIPRNRTPENSWRFDQYAAIRKKLGL